MKKVIVVGASSGIGRELALLYAAEGCEIGLVARRAELLDELADELKTKVHTQVLDVADTDKAIAGIEQLIAEMQGVDLMIISAGVGFLNDELQWEKEKQTIDVNVTGFAAIACLAMRHFIQQGSGHLVGISSIAAIRGSDIAPSYNASKAFMSNYLEGLRIKCSKKKLDIAVTDIRPGFVDTDMAKGDGLFWVAPPQKAANQIAIAIANKKKKVYITKRWILIAWLLKILPDFLYRRM